ncbi:Acyl transferase/acyl hydrolase/lysophospholipase [Penicillium cf. griseofulvum]|uniref:Acyl transferase/acyl hydrolase/lysophospholipase n=1 Tax=Penicillium cf. griseofulvum TaxID=2972120 RepID=A0A9W9T2P4_9EURO|nr:Acyl transferase/acyl hydrolase/lysophospholipase [Penicillium cf. griseofulvum]KAJ5440409.1 Acyl transferase/acyl hydrolase/lysophospholipase [Penicillium cf. griseofulvum]KAJ5448456.1 Acyl transferase/acyl hydrolase/lysophospholipase [Penicillium cf. griseofulvum]
MSPQASVNHLKATASEDNLANLGAESCTPIAIVGIGFRGPGDAKNVEKLWEMILAGREAWSPIPARRWNSAAFYHPDDARHGTINVEGGHFLEEDVSVFDAPFFNMTSDEAAAMDPQQRLLLEVAYEGLENAGIPLTKIMGTKTSCFVGSFSADYTDLLLRDPECVPMYQCTNAGQSRAMMANRLSYFFDLKGPSVTVDTACSGSLVALHLACQSLQTGDASTAIAAGVNLILSHEFMSTMSMMKFLSPDGRCHTFDEKANGYSRGEAAGCLILKPLAKALHDRNKIRAVIRSTGSNQDGRTAGITMPNGVAQERLIRSVYARADLDPSETDFVEAHGTGTMAGDPVETGAIARVFGAGRPPDNPVRIGSIKTNVGHLEGASGVAGVIKAVLMLENRLFLPNRNFDKINPRIPLGDWKLKVQLRPEPWETTGPRRVSVNSFGYGGSNAHVIVEDAQGCLSSWELKENGSIPTPAIEDHDSIIPSLSLSSCRILMVSGFDERTCAQQMQALGNYILDSDHEVDQEQFLDDLAFTVNERRSVFPWKTAVVGNTTAGLATSLSQSVKSRSALRKPTIGFVFTGQGAQWAGMGKELLRAYPAFKMSILSIDRHLKGIGSPFTVEEEITKPSQDSDLNHPSLSQTVCTALQIALVDLLKSWNIHPDSVTGHSSGEIAAAYAAGALSMNDAMSVAYYRGAVASQLLQDQPNKGTMMAVGMSAEEVQPYLDVFDSRQLVVACINSPSSVTISGDIVAIDELTQTLKEQQVFHRRLEVGVAYHSPHIERVAEQYHTLIEHIEPQGLDRISEGKRERSGSFFSSVTGTTVPLEKLDAQYWVSNLVGQVKFAKSLRTLCFETNGQRAGHTGASRVRRAKAAQKPSVDCLLEIGPHAALSGPIKQILQADEKLNSADINYISVLTRKANAVTTVLSAVATLASLNYPVDFGAINRPVGIKKTRIPQMLVDLPSYAWNHTRSYWTEPRLSKMYRNRRLPRMDLLGAPDNMACPFEPRWRNYLRTSELPWLLDHKIQGNIVFPAAGYLAMAIEASIQLNKDDKIARYILRDVTIQSALVLNETSAVEVMVSLQKSIQDQEHLFNFHIYSISEENRWTEHCNGLIGTQKSVAPSGDTFEETDGYAMVPLGTEVHGISVIDVSDFYEKLQTSGLEYGPCFANMTKARVTQDGACFAEVTIPDTLSVMPASFQHELLIHPCTLDSIFHTIFAALPLGMGIEQGPAVPVFIEEMTVSSGLICLPGELISICTHVRPMPKKDVTACIFAVSCNEKQFETEPTISLRGLRCARLDPHEPATQPKDNRIIYEIDWKPDSSFLSSNHAAFLFGENGVARDPAPQGEYEESAAGFIRAALEEVSTMEAMEFDTSHRRFRCYLQDVLERHDGQTQISVCRLGNMHPIPMGGLLAVIGQNLVGIIRNQVDLSTIMNEDHLLDEFWDIFSTDASYQAAAKYVELIGHGKPDISILEFGVGTGQIAEIFLNHLLTLKETSHCGKYTFAHESESVLEHTSKRLEAWSEWVECKPLDLGKDFHKQGFEKKSFDIIILPHGLCTARCEQKALSKIHDLLSPSGYLIAINPFDPKKNVLKNLLFGALHCLSGDEFCLGQGAWTESQWEEILQDAHFTEVDAYAEQDSEKSHQFIVAKKRKIQRSSGKVTIICEDNTEAISHLVTELKKASCEVNVTHLDDVDCQDQICLVLDTSRSSLLAALNEMTFSKIKAMFMQSEGVLWITKGATIEPVNPNAALAVGFARTARAESGINPIVTLDLDAQNPLSESQAAKTIARLLVSRFLCENTDQDTEYAEKEGQLLVPRVLESFKANKNMSSINDIETISEQPFHQLQQPLRLSRKIDNPGFVGDSEITDLPVGYIGIKVHSFTLNKCDIQRDHLDWSSDDTLGLECSGIVYKVSAGVHGITVGDRVACLGSGTARSFYHDRASAFQRINDQMSLQLASALPLAYAVAYYVVNHLSPIDSNDAILVHDAGSHYGQALLEVYLLRDARIFATVQSANEKDLLSSRYEIPGEHIFIIGKDDIAKGVLRLTDGKKANVVVTFETAEETILQNCTASFGRFIRLRTNNLKSRPLPCPLNMSMSTVNIFELQKERTDLANQIWPQVFGLFLQGRLKGPGFINVYHVSHIQEAITAIQTRQHVVVRVEESDLVTAALPRATQPLFRANASYMLVGGLGGIGREVASWMAQNGAKSLVFVNRSGLSKYESQETVRNLVEKGVQVTTRACDISDEIEVQRMLHDLSYCAPPIRGLIQAAMVLKDVHIENMRLDEYQDVMGPKYYGTWNLHRHLPADLEFFLMLSSISGIIGNATQAAYAAGCTFMDAFAAYRRSLGLPAVSLDLGTITDVGHLAENKDLAAKMERQGFQGTDTPTLLSLIQVAISQSTSGAAQLVTGLGQWRENESLGNFDAPLFAHFRYKFQGHSKSIALSDSIEGLKVELDAAKTVDQATVVICDALSRKIASHLSIPVENINPSNPVSEYGVDSHVAVELRNWVSRSMDCTVPILEILARSMLELSHKIASQRLEGKSE